MDIKYFVFLIAISTSSAVNVSIEGTLNIGKELLDVLADRVATSMGNSRRSLIPTQEDKMTSMIRYSLFKITSSANCSLYKFIEEYIVVLAKTMGRILKKALGDNFIEGDYETHVKKYVEDIKEVLQDNTEDSNPSYWIVTVKVINSKFQELISAYSEDVDENDLRYKIVLATVIMENKYLYILCVEHDMCSTKNKFSSAILAVLSELTKAPYEKLKSFLISLYRASFDTKLYSLFDDEFAHQLQVEIYEFVESPNRTVLLDFLKVVEDHLNNSVTERNTRHEDLIRAILSDLDIIYVVQPSAPFTEFLESFYVFLKSDVKLNMSKLLLEKQKVMSALASEFFDKLYNQVHVLLDIVLGNVPRKIKKVESEYSRSM